MILYRYMGRTELMRFIKGDTIKPLKHDWICFLSERTKVYTNKDSSDPRELDVSESLNLLLNDVVTKDILCKFEVPNDIVKPILARYSNPFGINTGVYSDGISWVGYFSNVIEYICDSYNNENFKLLNFQIIDGYNPLIQTKKKLSELRDNIKKLSDDKSLLNQLCLADLMYDEVCLEDKAIMKKWRYNKPINDFISLPERLKNTVR